MVNPYREPGMDRYWVPSTPSSAVFGTDIADYWFPVSTGGDIAFLSGVLKILIEKGCQTLPYASPSPGGEGERLPGIDQEFISRHTTSFDALKTHVAALNFDQLEAQSGLKRSSMEEFAALIRDAKTGVLVWSMGITQHRFGGDAV